MMAASALPFALALGACTPQFENRPLTTSEAAMVDERPEELRRFYRATVAQGPRNAVLNQLRAGLAAMDSGHFALAAETFDEALRPIEAIYADNPEAERARSLFVQEAAKPFRGEPYERMMAFYYRGLLYLRVGDWGNARASFRSAMLQDAMAEDERFQADAALMAWLEGWASHCERNGPLAETAFAEAARLNSAFTRPAADRNVLLIADLGEAPVKIADGPRRELLRIKPSGSATPDAAEFTVGPVTRRPAGVAATATNQRMVTVLPARSATANLSESLSFQAMTRGGRQFDHLLAGKAQFQAAAGAGGAAMTGMGLGMMAGAGGNRNMGTAGAVVLLVGLVAHAAAEATRTEADVRSWDNLPDRMVFTTMALPTAALVSGTPVSVRFQPNPDSFSTVSTTLAAENGARCGIAWARSHRATAIPDAAPGTFGVQR
jgi:tetratricopeptide (TPR) repeat protein